MNENCSGNPGTTHRSKTTAIAACAVALALIASACSSGSGKEAASEAAAGRTVHTEQVKAEQLVSSSSLAGTLEAYEETVVSFEADGRVLSVAVKEGDSVKAGDVLAQLNAADYELQLSRAEAAVQQAEAALQSANAGLNTAEAQVASAEANLRQVNDGARKQELEQAENAVEVARSAYTKAKTDAERTAALYEEGLVTLSDKENAELSLTNAEKQLANAEAQLSLVQEGATDAQKAAAEAGVEQAKAGVATALASQAQAKAAQQEALAAREQAQLMLSRTKLTAPKAGVVLERMVDEGELTGGGQPAIRLGRIDRLKTLLSVPDSEIADWKVGQNVTVELYGETRTGTVANIYPTASAGTGSVRVEVAIENKKLDWAPGQVVKASRSGEAKKGITVPAGAVISNGDKPYVFKAVDGKAVKTDVEIGELYGNRLLIASGLNEGDVIVTSGASLLLDGDPIDTAEEAGND
ncbi:efflux RND transporter periplasmic adaptor subunit [Paenibacillus thailandensis]|uniref:Efflux RND transporter periplasmic adaptor subunit n=1 Tax=Paenibacillus thailandensis TaxID=393250 RepID=A0ABW5QV12_9BACL